MAARSICREKHLWGGPSETSPTEFDTESGETRKLGPPYESGHYGLPLSAAKRCFISRRIVFIFRRCSSR